MITLSNSSASSSSLVANTSAATLRNSVSTPNQQPATRVRADLVQIPSSDTGLSGLVRPTEAQQVQQLYRQGHTVPQISSSLNLSVIAVDNYLNISRVTT
jgi:DNA-binding NarL/FixJ family response regulator